jgi:hypothetical protein
VLELIQKARRLTTTTRNSSPSRSTISTSTTILKSINPKQLSYYGEGISYLEDKLNFFASYSN